MEAGAKDLRLHPKRLLQTVARGEEVVITYHGKPCAKLVPMTAEPSARPYGDAFGMWKDHSETADVEAFVRRARKGRPMC